MCICRFSLKKTFYHRAEASPFPKNSSQKGRLWTPEGSSIMPVPGSRQKIIFLLNSVEICIF